MPARPATAGRRHARRGTCGGGPPDTAPRRPMHHSAARRVGRGAHHVLRWVGSLAAVVILVLLFGIWRLMQGPVELNWLTPYVEAAFQRSGIGLKMAISGVRLAIDRNTNQLDLAGGKRHRVPARWRAAGELSGNDHRVCARRPARRWARADPGGDRAARAASDARCRPAWSPPRSRRASSRR